MTDVPVPKRIAKGVALLDEKVPGWEKMVNLDTLDLSSGCGCVVGQLAVRKRWCRGPNVSAAYELGLGKLGADTDERIEIDAVLVGRRYGFATLGDYSTLTHVWRKFIETRLAA